MPRILQVVGLVTVVTACGNEAASAPSDAGAIDVAIDAAPDAGVDPCEQNATHDACVAASGCAWYSEPLCSGGSPLPLSQDGCFSAMLGSNPQCSPMSPCEAAQECVIFSAYEECGAGTACPEEMCGIVSSLCFPLPGH